MLLIRDVFKCKPGQAKNLIEKFKTSTSLMEGTQGFTGYRILVDYVASYWTVVVESETEDLAQFERHMSERAERGDVKEAMQGYMDLVESGHREIYRIV